MRRLLFFGLLLCACMDSWAQKKPLDHSVYDGWQSLGERAISNDGKFVVYSVTPQEGDATLVIQALDNSFKKEIPRGYSATVSEDSRFVIFRIRPFFKDTRDARIKKRTPDQMPKDTLAIFTWGKDSLVKIPRVKSFKTPEKAAGWVVYSLDKPLPETARPAQADSLTRLNNLLRVADSLTRVADSLRNKATEAKTKGMSVLQGARTGLRSAARPDDTFEEGTELVARNLATGEEKRFKYVSDYAFSKKGNVLLLETSRRKDDTLSKAAIVWINTSSWKGDTIFKKFNDAKNFAMDDEGTQLAFVAERDSVAKALQKFYRLYYFKPGMDSAKVRTERSSLTSGLAVSENSMLTFSKDGKKIFFGLSQIRRPKDTTLVDFETARLDVWHYNDDYLQPQQLVQLNFDARRSMMAVLNTDNDKVIPLATEEGENVQLLDEGNAPYVLVSSTKGNRVEAQWQGFARQGAWLVSTADGSKKPVKDKLRNFFTPSPKGRFIAWYDAATKHYFSYNIENGAVKNITSGIKEHLYDDEDDHPDDPGPFGTGGWIENDEAVLIYDRYDIWQVDPAGVKAPVNITNGFGKQHRTELRNVRFDREERFIKPGQKLVLEGFNRNNKYAGYYTKTLGEAGNPVEQVLTPNAYQFPIKAKQAEAYFVARSDIRESNAFASTNLKEFTKLSNLNPQQTNYNWMTADLMKWKMFDGKEAEGLIFKPENFDPKKKYPVIFYFYEKNADLLYNYRAPAPSASTVNIAYFTSNGYIVVDPNIYYKTGQPGEDAYNSVVSAAKHLAKMPWVDSTKMAIQGQSWGGYQVAYLVTRTNMFAAAGAGAPVANMTSAYGGIRWGTGLNRQFQYERTQSRIGATLWQKPDLYIKNSPLFKADKIKTPLLIMHNDADGSVPWYQGIEMFTAMRRLNKKVWMLQYNGEDHNLVERRNRKDLSIRLAQYFDHFLKGAPAAKWISAGVPATAKGIDWGTSIEGEEKKGF
ncbi:MAG: S9 family peptidase [Gemmatimonadaceae bacterium]|nr:S9 family peptidase [Chitinophagaceae bacterium]